MTRSKDPEIKQMADALQEFETLLLGYAQRLEEEWRREREAEAYPPLTRGLKRQIAMLKAVHTFIDEEMWEQMLLLANTSQSISHRRTRRFF